MIALPKLKQFSTDEEPLFYEESFQLTCSVIHGDSPFTFQWLFQNNTIENTFDIKVENSKKRSILTIDSVSAKHAGEYTLHMQSVEQSWIFYNHNHAGCEGLVLFDKDI
jgi:hypothetical protein